jgi:hypothetical protein
VRFFQSLTLLELFGPQSFVSTDFCHQLPLLTDPSFEIASLLFSIGFGDCVSASASQRAIDREFDSSPVWQLQIGVNLGACRSRRGTFLDCGKNDQNLTERK